MSITSQGQFPVSGTPSFAALADSSSAPVTFGYYQQNVAEARAAVEHNRAVRRGPIGWWNRHPVLTAGLSFAVTLNLALLPMAQNAMLTVLGNVL
ncbi:hypothetical protein [Nocardia brasiliensis]|uniref:Uncharacterized protein n=1 Tax=Nocardia brasiliensis (strain ATCC 700358 / HUJEG-1) TaxID=1133849 RepID=K0F2N0_NOCB7|nr:hypothetical protein [Nocardia brasiliensis]AFU03987.1 hypothetical protein O3I_030190 [Nocardia brasiliensis ATCC 700358]OCF91178.1 hypothetical protein AW168_05070 [Nocardia brasiliensis]